MQRNNTDKKELIAELYYLSLDRNVDGRAFYYMMEAIMAMFKTENEHERVGNEKPESCDNRLR